MHKKEIGFLITLMVVFFLISILALVDILLGIPILEIGLSPMMINALVMVLSFFGMVKTIWHLAFNY